MEPVGFVSDVTCDRWVFNAIPSSRSPSNRKPCIRTLPSSTSSSSSPGSNTCLNRNRPCPGDHLFDLGWCNGKKFWESFQRNVRKYMECFRLVEAGSKDARRVQPMKPAGNVGYCSERNTEEHNENLKALILHCKNS